MKTSCQRHEFSLHEPTPPTSAPAWWSGILANCRGVLDRLVPMGYQDEFGFHLGQDFAQGMQESAPRQVLR